MLPARLAFAFLALALLGGNADAHGRRPLSLEADGIEIPSSGHGELLVLTRHYGAIIALAGRHAAPDPTLRKLANYARIQRAYCFWGLAPYAASDEASPFNECSHAYLSAAKQLLLHMRTTPALADEANALVSTIDMEMIRKGLAFIGCQYSGDVFHTGEFLTPHWELIAEHPPTLVAASLPFGVLALAGVARTSMRRRATARPAG